MGRRLINRERSSKPGIRLPKSFTPKEFRHIWEDNKLDTALHLMTFLADRSAGLLSNTLEILLVHVDLETRRSVPLPAQTAAAFDTHIAQSRELNWAAPICGAIGIRRKVTA